MKHSSEYAWMVLAMILVAVASQWVMRPRTAPPPATASAVVTPQEWLGIQMADARGVPRFLYREYMERGRAVFHATLLVYGDSPAQVNKVDTLPLREHGRLVERLRAQGLPARGIRFTLGGRIVEIGTRAEEPFIEQPVSRLRRAADAEPEEKAMYRAVMESYVGGIMKSLQALSNTQS